MKRKKIIKFAIFAVVLAFILIVGGTFLYTKMNASVRISFGVHGNVVFRIEKEVCTKDEVTVLLLDKKKQYDELYGNEIWNKNIDDISAVDYLKNDVINRLAMYKCVKLMAEDKKIILSNSDKTKAERYAQEYIEQFTESDLSSLGITKSAVKSIFEEKILFEKVYDSLTTTVNREISVDEARVIKLQYIFVSASLPDAQNLINEYYTRVTAGENFEKLASDNNGTEGYECQLARGTVEEAFEDAAFNLNTDEISQVVKTAKGYYIIKCINDYEKVATENNKQTILNNRKNAIFDEIYKEFTATLYYEYNEKNIKDLNFDTSYTVKVTTDEILK